MIKAIGQLVADFLDGVEMVARVKEPKEDMVSFPNPEHKVRCRSCGTKCFWGCRWNDGKWLLYEEPSEPHLHNCAVNPYVE